jgi:HK97 family phage prohead protease
MITKDREYRSFEFETSEMRVEGMPVVFEQPTVLAEIDGVRFYEVIDRNAFNEAKMDDVVLNIDHGGKPAAKTKNGTLELRLSNDGLFISADLSKNVTGRELHEDIQNGFYDKMSFAFTVREDEYDKKTRTRRIMKIDRLFDVSAVTFPAYNQTSIMARDSFAMELEKERIEIRQREDKKKRLALRLQIEGGLE